MTAAEIAALAELAERAIAATEAANERGLPVEFELDRLRTRNARLMDFEVAASPSTIKRLIASHAALRAERADLLAAKDELQFALQCLLNNPFDHQAVANAMVALSKSPDAVKGE